MRNPVQDFPSSRVSEQGIPDSPRFTSPWRFPLEFVPMRLGNLVTCLMLSVAASAYGQVRSIPKDAERGNIRHLQDMVVQIGGKPLRLAPGAQIRDASNRLVLPTALPAGVPVKYLVDAEGMVRQVWILTPEEAAQR